jgi:hypothetical protein
MSEMVERAAKAYFEFCDDDDSIERCAWDEADDDEKECARGNARAALLAALDPEDEALRREIVFSGLVTHAEAKRIISALRALAQGAPTE